jgi:hypothetical protein
MSPPKLKVYGLIWMTRRTYLTVQLAGVACLLILLIIMAVVAKKPRPQPGPGERLPPFVVAVDLFFVNLPWIFLAALLLVGLETWIVLRKFNRLDAQQQLLADLKLSPPGGAGPSATGGNVPPAADASGPPANP